MPQGSPANPVRIAVTEMTETLTGPADPASTQPRAPAAQETRRPGTISTIMAANTRGANSA